MYENRKWTKEEIDFLIEWHGTKSNTELSRLLNRSTKSISTKASRLGITGPLEKSQHQPTIEISDYDLAWAAGFIEADGCFQLTSKKGRTYLHRCVSVNQLEERKEVLEHLQAVFGGSIRLFKKESCKNGQVLIWRIHSKADISNLIQKIYPYMKCEQKKFQALRLLEAC